MTSEEKLQLLEEEEEMESVDEASDSDEDSEIQGLGDGMPVPEQEQETAEQQAKEALQQPITDRETLFTRIEQLTRLLANWQGSESEGG